MDFLNTVHSVKEGESDPTTVGTDMGDLDGAKLPYMMQPPCLGCEEEDDRAAWHRSNPGNSVCTTPGPTWTVLYPV